MSMKFEIRDVLYVTTAVAVLVAFARFWFAGFLITFVLANALLIFCQFAILFTTIIFRRPTWSDVGSKYQPALQDAKEGLAALDFVCCWVVAPNLHGSIHRLVRFSVYSRLWRTKLGWTANEPKKSTCLLPAPNARLDQPGIQKIHA
jgi:hypothetical protein